MKGFFKENKAEVILAVIGMAAGIASLIMTLAVFLFVMWMTSPQKVSGEVNSFTAKTRETLRELIDSEMLEEPYKLIERIVEKELEAFFKQENKKMYPVLQKMSKDPYIDIIYGRYRDDMSMTEIAEQLEIDKTTAYRHKKRLIVQIYDELNRTQRKGRV